jgi:hypothetical protein
MGEIFDEEEDEEGGCLVYGMEMGFGIEGGGGFESGRLKFVDFVFGGCEVRGVSVWVF